eukprot:UN01027
MSTTVPIDKVNIEGSVLLKIIKHCRENSPNTVYGQNLGHQVGSTLQITNCFPLIDIDSYNSDMLTLLQSSHYDATQFGLYCSTIYSEYFELEMCQVMAQHQTLYPNSVMILYNPVLTQNGVISIRVVRLSEEFLAVEKANSFTPETFKKYQAQPDKIFQNVPFFIHNPHIVHAYLYELNQQNLLSAQDMLLNPTPSQHAMNLINQLSTVVTTSNGHQNASYLEQYQLALERYQRDVTWVNKQRADHARKCDEIRAENARREQNKLRPLNLPEAPKIQEPSIIELYLLAQRIGSISTDLFTLANLSSGKQNTLKRMITVSESNSGAASAAAATAPTVVE